MGQPGAQPLPVIAYPTKGNEGFKDYSGPELARMITVAATLYASVLPERALRKSSNDPPKVIGLLGVSSLEYVVTFLAAQRLGLTTLLFSTRLSDAGYKYLVEKTQCQAVLVQSRYQPVMDRVQSATGGLLAVVPMFEGTYLFNPAFANTVRPLDIQFDWNRERKHPGAIIHSSGSTGLPKPVPQLWDAWVDFLGSPEMHPKGRDLLITVPLYHGFGALNLVQAIVFGNRISLVNASLPITGPHVLTALEASKCTSIATVPYTLKLLAETPGGIEKMARLAVVQFGGSACPDELGDRLVAAGVNVSNTYGATETGGLMARSKDQWNWLVPLPHAEPYLEFEREAEDDNLYHLVVKPGLESKVLSTRSDGSYDTKDLFARHPTDPRKWKFVRRKDDTIVLVNGEKANPVPLEDAVKQHPDVQIAVGFGAQRAFLGMIVIPGPEAKDVPKHELVARIWPRLEAANRVVPAYARISRDAVIVKEAGTPFPVTEKLTLKRAQFVQQFRADIDAFYERMAAGGVAAEAKKPPELYSTVAGVRDLVRRTVCETLQLQNASELTDDTDFFLLGMDSLQATQARNSLAKELGVGEDQLPVNVAFENPSVARLAQFIIDMKREASPDRSRDEVEMELVKKYSQFRPVVRKESTKRPGKEVVVLTGATGSLGRHLLNTLLQTPHVSRVYCFVRAASPNAALTRTHAALRNARLLAALTPAQTAKIVALPYDLSQPDLALPRSTYDEIASTATTVIHNAWAVNFNMALASFERHCIAGTQHLLALCLRSPFTPLPTFTFISTIGAVMRSPESPIRERLYPLAAADPIGYSRSKWCAERICEAASAKAGVPARVVRIGQIVGDSQHGLWNAKEAVPLTVLAARTVGALPLVPEGRDALSWLPVDVTARAVVEVAGVSMEDGRSGTRTPREGLDVYHVCHPRAVSWNREFLPALRRAGLRFETLSGPEWVRRLEASERDPARNPPMKLINWFRAVYGESALSLVALDLTESRKVAPSLRDPKPVSQEEMAKYLRYWTEEAWAELPLAAPPAKAKM
ncbi:hypothetical protein B0J12DRAFT_570374 [Macrophomina phaseolina]|uniref:Carrier domain-containing protein n=1 Tax=Macrophomina phaseolina TaxID=35725 RepID=A0ABQ8GIC6_9PEZI|nr:hypothetical protein B0J12DRAFT_570374 [Macrophomina phaseolina]